MEKSGLPLLRLVLVLGWSAVFFVATAVVVSTTKERRPPPREGFFAAELRQDRPFRVFQAKPKRGIRLIVPSAEKPHPASLRVLERYGDAGVSVAKDLSPVADVAERQTTVDAFLSGKTRDDLVVTDTASLFRAHASDYRVLSYLRDSEKRFCVFGGVNEEEGENEDAFADLTLRKLLLDARKRRKKEERPRFLCVSDLDVWMLKTVAAMAAGVVDLEAVADVRRVRLKDLGSTAAKGGGGKGVVACLLTERHRVAVWNHWKERDAVWYDYWDDADADRLRVAVPFYKPVAVDVRHAFLPSLKGQRNVYTTLAVDAVLVGRASLGSHPLLPLVAEVLIRDDVDRELDVVSANNYLMQHFAFYRATHAVCAAKNAEIYKKRASAIDGGALAQIGRPKFQVLEQFEEEEAGGDAGTAAATEISMRGRRVRAYWETLHDTDRKVARVTMHVHEEPALRVHQERFMSLRGVPVRYGDRVTLDGEERGGTYFVEAVDAGRGRLTLSDKWRFSFDPSRGDRGQLEDEGGDEMRVVLTASGDGREVLRPRGGHDAAVRPGDPVYVSGFGRRGTGLTGRVKEVRRDSTTVVLEIAEDDDDDGGEDERMGGGGHHICVEDMRMKSRPQCEAAGNTWDRPCRADEECPYFQTNKHYRNYRGGCVDGYCEMPVGVEVRGFRVPVPSPAPACHGCEEEPWDFSCCAKQEDPDFAFVNDFNRRKRDAFAMMRTKANK